ncbi:hypothetical protein BU15DRAFT_77278 [Melanogaster broomeanus]|nr:hypothetical protein BU15DRAFT_77278 [Melanogaster broomeanus]
MSWTTRSHELVVLRVTLKDVQNELDAAKVLLADRTAEIKEQGLALSEKEDALGRTQGELHIAQDELHSMCTTLRDTQDQLSATRTKSSKWYSLLRLERRKVLRLKGQSQGLTGRLKMLENTLVPALNAKTDTMANEMKQKLADAEASSSCSDGIIALLRDQLSSSLTIAREKRSSSLRFSQARRLFDRGKSAYSMKFRSIARSLVLAGCARKEVGSVIQSIAATFGVHAPKRMSGRTVGRIMLEGGLASQIQVAHEIVMSDSITISSDSTSHRHIDYTSRHVAMKMPQLASQKDTGSHVIRLLGVDSSVNHKADTQLEELKAKVNMYTNLYNNSPLSHRTETRLSSLDSGKKDNAYLKLGQDTLRGPLSSDLVEAVAAAHDEALKQAGGLDAWNDLSKAEQSARESAAQECVARQLGMVAFNSLSEKEQRQWSLIVRAGCCMHKELNGVKGGCAEMAACWEESGFERPVLLANKDNAATLKGISDTDNTDARTMAELRAFEVSGQGGPKTTSIAGAIFNNKDDKKGLQDVHRQYFAAIKGPGGSTTFPDTSNVRYQSHCFAAEELITYLDNYIALLIQTRYKKEKRNFSHMEENLFNALNDTPTLTELAVLVLYAAAIGQPYMLIVRGDGSEETNILDLGPFHNHVKNHTQKLINSPDLLLAPDASPKLATLDGETWQNAHAITVVHKLAKQDKLPNLKNALVAFFRGSLRVWNRLTSEFASDSTNSSMSTMERERAWMPTTNDRNEGALGAYRVRACQKPTMTLHQYNAEALYRHNNTADFISSTYTEEDQRWLMLKAREVDASGLEHSRHTELNAHAEKVAHESRVKETERLNAVANETARVDAITLIIDITTLEHLTRAQLDDQLAVHRRCNPTIKAKSNYKNRDAKLTAVKAAVADFLNPSSPQTTRPPGPSTTSDLINTLNPEEKGVQPETCGSESDSDSELY